MVLSLCFDATIAGYFGGVRVCVCVGVRVGCALVYNVFRVLVYVLTPSAGYRTLGVSVFYVGVRVARVLVQVLLFCLCFVVSRSVGVLYRCPCCMRACVGVVFLFVCVSVFRRDPQPISGGSPLGPNSQP